MKALITGITGQDGSYLAELLLEKGYVVYGIIRRSSSFNTKRIDHIYNNPNLRLRHGDVTDMSCLIAIMKEIKDSLTNPDTDRVEIYNLAAQSHVKVSFEMPLYTGQVDALGTTNMLETIRVLDMVKNCRFYQASTSELYGKVQEIPQTEETPFYPRSPYAVAKLYSYWIVKNYREAYGIHASNGILFNHTGPRRGKTFVCRKITHTIRKIMDGTAKEMILGNLDAKRDWGHAKDYVKAMWLMLQKETPVDLVIASGECHTVREFVEIAFKYIDVEIGWRGEGVEEEGYCKKTGRVYVRVDPKYFRPTEVELLLGDPRKAKRELGWQSEYTFEGLVKEMMEYDYNKIAEK